MRAGHSCSLVRHRDSWCSRFPGRLMTICNFFLSYWRRWGQNEADSDRHPGIWRPDQQWELVSFTSSRPLCPIRGCSYADTWSVAQLLTIGKCLGSCCTQRSVIGMQNFEHHVFTCVLKGMCTLNSECLFLRLKNLALTQTLGNTCPHSVLNPSPPNTGKMQPCCQTNSLPWNQAKNCNPLLRLNSTEFYMCSFTWKLSCSAQNQATQIFPTFLTETGPQQPLAWHHRVFSPLFHWFNCWLP